MNRDEYLAYKTRADIVNAFIARLEKVDTNDLQLIPALQAYVEDGDKTRFEEYNRWHFVMDEPERKAKIEAAEQKVKKYEQLNDALQKNLDSQKQYAYEYKQAFFELSSEIDDLVIKSSKFGESHLTLGDIKKFHEANCLNPNKVIYIEKEGKVHSVSNIFLNDYNKVIFRLTEEGIPVPPAMRRSHIEYKDVDIIADSAINNEQPIWN